LQVQAERNHAEHEDHDEDKGPRDLQELPVDRVNFFNLHPWLITIISQSTGRQQSKKSIFGRSMPISNTKKSILKTWACVVLWGMCLVYGLSGYRVRSMMEWLYR